MIYPEFIKEKALIGVCAPSNGGGNEFKNNKYKNAIKTLKGFGYNLKLSKNLYKSNKGRSASALIRAKEVNEMFENKDIDLILCAGGGEFLIEILPYVDFNLLKNNPKYVCGFSDPTGLLYTITTKYDIATIYGQNFSQFGMNKLHKSQYDFLNIIKGNIIELNNYDLYEKERSERINGLEYYNLTEKVKYKSLDNKNINVKGRIIGGCFDIISEICGTKYDGIKEFQERYKDDGIIWYFDNCDSSMEETIRILWKLNELDYFKYTKCVIFGRFGNPKTYFDYDTKECLKDSALGRLNIPVIYDADISHASPCMPIINGSIANIKLNKNKCSISFELK